MADIRINALATTAASTASDDFIAVDGSANGTRKLDAFSPTFGGNLTVNGTGTQTLNGKLDVITAASSAANVDIAVLRQNYAGTAGHEGLISFTNISGTSVGKIGTRAVDGSNTSLVLRNFVSGSLADALTLSPSVATLSGNLTVSGTGTSTFGGTIRAGAGSGETLGAGSVDVAADLGIKSTQGIVQGGARIVAFTNGNTLLGTGTDSSNGKLQLATHTTSAGGIGFGTDTSLYRYGAGRLAIEHVGGIDALLFWSNSGTLRALGEADGSTNTFRIGSLSAGWSTAIVSGNNATALTLDSSQNAYGSSDNTYFSWDGNSNRIGITKQSGSVGKFTYGSASSFTISQSSGTTIQASNTFTDRFTIDSSGNATFTGSIAINNTVQTAASVASTHKVTISIGGSTYYLLATNV